MKGQVMPVPFKPQLVNFNGVIYNLLVNSCLDVQAGHFLPAREADLEKFIHLKGRGEVCSPCFHSHGEKQYNGTCLEVCKTVGIEAIDRSREGQSPGGKDRSTELGKERLQLVSEFVLVEEPHDPCQKRHLAAAASCIWQLN